MSRVAEFPCKAPGPGKAGQVRLAGSEMNRAYILIVFSIVFSTVAVLLATIPARRRQWRTALIVLGAVFQSYAVFLLWSGQQNLSQQSSSKIVLDIKIDQQKVLRLNNVGFVDVEDIKVFLTTYQLEKRRDRGGHLLLGGIDTYSKVSAPIETFPLLKSKDQHEFDLKTLPKEMMKLFTLEQSKEEDFTQYHALRVAFRNSITKQKQVHYKITSGWIGGAEMFDNLETQAAGGGYESSRKFFELRRLIKLHQADFFGDNENDFYEN